MEPWKQKGVWALESAINTKKCSFLSQVKKKKKTYNVAQSSSSSSSGTNMSCSSKRAAKFLLISVPTYKKGITTMVMRIRPNEVWKTENVTVLNSPLWKRKKKHSYYQKTSYSTCTWKYGINYMSKLLAYSSLQIHWQLAFVYSFNSLPRTHLWKGVSSSVWLNRTLTTLFSQCGN